MAISDAAFLSLKGTPKGGFKDKGITKSILATIPEKGKGAVSLKEVMAAVLKIAPKATEKGVLNTIYVLRKGGKVEVNYNEKEDNQPYYRKLAPKAAPATPAK
jgi:hypothetical protein